METVFFFKNMGTSEEETLRDYVMKKMPQLEKLLSHFPEDGVILQIKAEKFQKHSAFDVEFVLKLPFETISAREASHTITKAVDFAKDRLTMQLKKSIEHIRRNHRNIKMQSSLKRQIVETV